MKYGILSDAPRMRHHNSLAALRSSANHGCHLCCQFILGLADECWLDSNEKKKYRSPNLTKGSLEIIDGRHSDNDPERWDLHLVLPSEETLRGAQDEIDWKTAFNPISYVVLFVASQQGNFSIHGGSFRYTYPSCFL